MSACEQFPWIVPLFNFQSDAQSMTLNEITCLRPIKPGELQKTVERLPLGEMLRHWLVWNIFYVLEIKIEDLGRQADDMVLAFRLLKTGDLRAPLAFQVKGDREYHFKSTPYVANVLSKNTYFLKVGETANFVGLWSRTQNVASKPHLDFPLKRFMEAYEENTPEDKIVEYMTAFESIVFHNVGDTGRKSIPLAVAVSVFLGSSQEERDRIRSVMISAYDIRNARVHGLVEKLKKHKEENIEGHALEVEDYLRRTLRRLVEE